LGTFVEITAQHTTIHLKQRAIQAAFDRINDLEVKMSLHCPDSDVSQLNAVAHEKELAVSHETYTVLQESLRLFELTNGLFDIAYKSQNGTSRDIVLLPNNQVTFLKPLTLDLGGIAKGYAVDEAIATLAHHGIKNACVNAGGDLRYLGKTPPLIWTRYAPHYYEQSQEVWVKEHKAMATSFPSENRDDLSATTYKNGATRQTLHSPMAITVVAKTCLLADALTKLVMIMGESSETLLNQLNAVAFVRPVEGLNTDE